MTAARLKSRHENHLARKFFHALSGTIITILFIGVFDRKQSAMAMAFGVLLTLPLDVLRLRSKTLNSLAVKLFGPLMRDEEERGVSAQFFYVLGLAWAIMVLPKAVAVQSILTLAWMDPLAAFFGQKYGLVSWKKFLTEKIKFENSSWISALGNKTLMGSSAGFVAAFIAGIVAWSGPWAIVNFQEAQYAVSVSQTMALAAFGAAVAAVAEAWPSQWDDNISVPFWTGLAVWALATIIGAPTSF